MKPSALHFTNAMIALAVCHTSPWVFGQGFFAAVAATYAALGLIRVFKGA